MPTNQTLTAGLSPLLSFSLSPSPPLPPSLALSLSLAGSLPPCLSVPVCVCVLIYVDGRYSSSSGGTWATVGCRRCPLSLSPSLPLSLSPSLSRALSLRMAKVAILCHPSRYVTHTPLRSSSSSFHSSFSSSSSSQVTELTGHQARVLHMARRYDSLLPPSLPPSSNLLFLLPAPHPVSWGRVRA